MAQHGRYWSCSPFADFIRGTKKLSAGTSKEWDTWHTQAKMKYNFRYWLAEEGLDCLQDFVTWPVRKIYNIKYYINNRWVSRTHSLTAHHRDIKPGEWCDVGHRFLPCLFNELVDFVEIESAWSHITWGSEEDRAKYNPPFWAKGWWRWRTWRCPQAGLDHLDWAMTLKFDDEWISKDDPDYGKPTDQANRAREIKELYVWWTETFRNRPNAYDASGWSDLCEKRRLANPGEGYMGSLSDRTGEEREESRRVLDLCSKIEREYNEEETEMMIRLIKARTSLWT